MRLLTILAFSALFAGCIGDDFVIDRVDPILTITQTVDSLAVDTEHMFAVRFLNEVGIEEAVAVNWSSSDDSILSISGQGIATGHTTGTVQLIAQYEGIDFSVTDSVEVHVGSRTVIIDPVVSLKGGLIQTTSSYLLTGTFTLTQDGSDLVLEIEDDYRASTSLPGLYLYVTNNPNTTAGAREIGAVRVFTGAHEYRIPDADLEEYQYLLYFCKPFNVKVGDALITEL